MTQKKKALLVIPKLSNGGIERIASNISMGLNENIEQKIFSIMNQEISYEYKVKPDVLAIPLGSNFLSKLFVSIRRLLKLYRLKKPNTVTISFGERCNILNMLIYKKDIRIISCHSVLSIENKSKGFIGSMYTFLSKKLYPRADAIIAVSNEVKKDLVDNFNLDYNIINVINNGYNIDEIKKLSLFEDSFFVNEDTLNIITVGRITYAKGTKYQLYILKKLIDKGIKSHLYIVGDEEKDGYKKTLLCIIDELGLDEYVTFLGYKNNVYTYIRKCDLFLLTSIFEGFAGVLIESLACNTPFITSDSKGPLDIYKHTSYLNNCAYLNSFSGKDNLDKNDIYNIDLFVDRIITGNYKSRACLGLDVVAMKFDISVMSNKYSDVISRNY